MASLRVAVGMFQDMGRLSISAKHLKDEGETYEKAENFEAALEAYEQAADIYAGEESSSTANTCKLKVAEIAALVERYPLAVERYEEVVKASMDNNLLRFSVKGYLLCAGIVRLCYQEPHGVKNAMERYEDVDPSFAGRGNTSSSAISRTRRRLATPTRSRAARRVRLDEPAGPVEDQDAAQGEEEPDQGGRGGGGRPDVGTE